MHPEKKSTRARSEDERKVPFSAKVMPTTGQRTWSPSSVPGAWGSSMLFEEMQMKSATEQKEKAPPPDFTRLLQPGPRKQILSLVIKPANLVGRRGWTKLKIR